MKNFYFSLGEREWLNDFSLHCCIKSVTPLQSRDQYSLMYPITVEVLPKIFNSESEAFQKDPDEKHYYAVPLNTGRHGVALFFLGNTKKIYSLIRLEILPVKEYLILSIKVSFAWKHITAKSSYNMIAISVVFGAVFFANVCVEYLKNYKNSVNKSESTEFLKFISSYLIKKKMINCSKNLINAQIDFAKTLR